MAGIDLSAIKKKLENLNKTNSNTSSSGKSEVFWKPTAGETTIRIVPYIHNPEFPFVELPLYYNYTLQGEKYPSTLLSPSFKNDPDPIVEFTEKAKAQNKDKAIEDWKKTNAFIRKMEPQLRTYCPIIVRGKESEGVKFWAFGQGIYKELLAIIADDDYGDISDPKTGKDIIVEYTPAPNKETFAKTSFRVRAKSTVLSNDESVIESIKKTPEVSTLFKMPTYDELVYALKLYTGASPETTTDSKPTKKEFKDDFQADINEPVPTAAADVSKRFDDLFANK
jgi:hypothetical protein